MKNDEGVMLRKQLDEIHAALRGVKSAGELLALSQRGHSSSLKTLLDLMHRKAKGIADDIGVPEPTAETLKLARSMCYEIIGAILYIRALVGIEPVFLDEQMKTPERPEPSRDGGSADPN